MIALAVNIDMMINDPFVGMSTEAIATDTDSGTTGTNQWILDDLYEYGYCYKCDYLLDITVESLCDCEVVNHICIIGGTEACVEGQDIYYSNCDNIGTDCNGPFEQP